MTVSHAYAEKDSVSNISATIQNDDISVLTKEEIISQISRYEKMFGMSSEEFLRQKRNGTAPDTCEAMDWAGLLLHLTGYYRHAF